MFDVIVIGGGAAGLLAAGKAGESGKQVLLLEKNNCLGKKLAITGKGRCNFTNYSDVKNHLENCPHNGKFLTNALYRFSPDNVLDLFQALGVEYKVERGNRVFPVSDKAGDIVTALQKYTSQNKVKISYEKVVSIAKFENTFTILTNNKTKFQSKAVIIATGGKSYPKTGSTGDGYTFARKFGHNINLLKPSLVPIEIKEKWVKELMGLSLKNIEIRVFNRNNKMIYQDFGEMLFTHFGVSGPVILSASSHIKDVRGLVLEIDLKPALDEDTLDKRLLREINQNHNKHYQNFLKHLLPQKLINVIIQLSQIEAHRPAHSIKKQERKKLVHILKHLSLSMEKFRPISEAIITSGGVCVNEIDPYTMESKLVKNLYFAGEVIDVDSYTGGYNLQIAFSTGYLAGENAAQ